MAPLVILVISFILLRGVGLLGVRRLSSWREAGLYAVAIMFLFTGSTHFTGIKYVYAALNEIEFRGEPPTPLWLRAPIQLFFIGMVLWTSTKRHSEKVEQSQVKEPVVEHEHP